MSKFNVGDRIAFYEEMEREVCEVYFVDDSDKTLYIYGIGWVQQQQCRKIKIKEKLKFEIGDRVWAKHFVNDKRLKGTIVRYHKGSINAGQPWEVKFDIDGEKYWCFEDGIKKLKMVKKKKPQLKVGDRVFAKAYCLDERKIFASGKGVIDGITDFSDEDYHCGHYRIKFDYGKIAYCQPEDIKKVEEKTAEFEFHGGPWVFQVADWRKKV